MSPLYSINADKSYTIGQSVLKHFTLTLDHGKQVTLEP
jgi:hypothetical protein